MGKGFNNYMTKKFFHPGSKENIKRVWMAEQKAEHSKNKQEELLNQYQKEHELYGNRALLGDEKAKLGLSFMYDAPPGMKKEKEKEDDEPEYKFEWQRKFNAPRESYAKNDETIRDQPFGIEVRNVRCIKCRKWGHVNTDKICPLYGQSLTAEPPQPSTSASSLLESLEDDGYALKKSIVGAVRDPTARNQQIIANSEDEDDPEVQFLKSLTPKQKKKLLKKLSKLQQKQKEDSKSMKHKKHKKHKTKCATDSDSDSSSDSDSHKKHKSKKHRKEKYFASEMKTTKERDGRKECYKDEQRPSDADGNRYKQETRKNDRYARNYTDSRNYENFDSDEHYRSHSDKRSRDHNSRHRSRSRSRDRQGSHTERSKYRYLDSKPDRERHRHKRHRTRSSSGE